MCLPNNLRCWPRLIRAVRRTLGKAQKALSHLTSASCLHCCSHCLLLQEDNKTDGPLCLGVYVALLPRLLCWPSVNNNYVTPDYYWNLYAIRIQCEQFALYTPRIRDIHTSVCILIYSDTLSSIGLQF